MTPLPFTNSTAIPLAERMRPSTLDEFIGQEHLLGKEKSFRRLIEKDALGSIILWGPSGTGKTTLARIISTITKKRFEEISAVNSGVADIRKIIGIASGELRDYGQQTILFIDEVHRFNKAQQDSILPNVENGSIQLIGATTENPSFEVIPPLRSRCRIFRMNYLSYEHIKTILNSAIQSNRGLGNIHTEMTPKAIEKIIVYANGDARFALNLLEAAVSSGEKVIDDILQQPSLLYDKLGDEHYNHASAFQKSMRGSDPDAAVYWLGKMIAGGEDPRFIARRLLITAAEDVGNANPQALLVAHAAAETAERLGFPEARIPLAQAAIYVAISPKSNSSITAIDKVLDDIQNKGKSYPVPDHIKDSHYKDAKQYGFGCNYLYPHDYNNHYIRQDYLPEQIKDAAYYVPGDSGEEKEIKERMKKRKND